MFYLIWGHLFSWRDCEGSEGCGQDRHGTCGSDRRTEHKRGSCGFYPYQHHGRWDHYHETLPDPKSQRIVHVYRPQIFLLDSMAFENICQQQYSVKPDFIEVLPGVMPRIIEKLCHLVKIKIIAGGLISDRESVVAALDAGAMGVSSTSHQVWRL